MSEELEFENHWKPRKPIILTCPDGSKCEVVRPGPELSVKTAHLQRRMLALHSPIPDLGGKTFAEMTEEEKGEAGLRIISEMTPEQRETNYQIARITVASIVKRPKLHLNPKDGELGVDDISETAFWYLVRWHNEGCPNPEESEEVTQAEVARFPVEQAGGDGGGSDVSRLRAEAESVDEAA
jgi:hypothetical protein